MNIIVETIKTLFILIPAYIANASPTLIKGKHPIDFKKRFGKNRLFGDGKTIEGFIFGTIIGTLSGFILIYIYPLINTFTNVYGFSLPQLNLYTVFLISTGALTGDLIGSFIKRRLNYKRGESILFLDQLDFISGMLLFSYWFVDITLLMVIIMIILTLILHRITCIIGYKLKIKKEPW
ncbi:MAG: CDP-2,3-bis-(O-geranylgeranyl)-sn-glycerol synthase [Candidatus Aenigmarchaeota archaeon]|nr:CDP-2,3-bis-(O-geranylgeranyl)-sn-glycerol synthase [Candidatus Aenigmarchaeota archaeon]